MANLAVPAVTAGAGFLIGGPLGAQIGWLAGSAYMASKQEIRQPAVGDLRIQTAQYGLPITYVVGAQRIAGNIIWASPKREYEIRTRTGKGGGPTTIQTGYKQDMAILLCRGRITGISRMWANNQIIVNGNALQISSVTGGSGYNTPGTYQGVPLLGGSGTGARAEIIVGEGRVKSLKITFDGAGYQAGDVLTASSALLGGSGSGFQVSVTSVAKPANLPGILYLGTDTQMPDPTMEAVIGEGNVPGYRGLAYMVLTDFDLGVSGAVPQFSFEVLGTEGF